MTTPYRSFACLSLCGLLIAACGDSSSNVPVASGESSDSGTTFGLDASASGSESEACTAECIEADLEMPDGSKVHFRRTAVGVRIPSLRQVGVGSIQSNGDIGIALNIAVEKVQLNAPTAAVSSAADGPTLTVIRSGQAGQRFVGEGGQIVFSALSKTSGGTIDGKFDGIVATRSGTADVVKVTNGVFHGNLP
jgi:hypothetical protein